MIRVLLRGLLRLHHFRVLGEAAGEEPGLTLIRAHSPQLLMVDTSLTDGSVPSLLAQAREIAPTMRSVLVAHASPVPAPSLPDHEVDAILERPFRVKDFARAVGAVHPEPG
ncbi:MAG: hypothetical protein ACYDFT_00390 [Thermoplasmata archaeon]